MATTEEALAQVLMILAKAESVREQRLLAETSSKEVPTTVLVTRQHLSHGIPTGPQETKVDETLAIHRYVTQPATVNAEVGVTINIGNFESVRVHIGLTVPCYKEEIDDCFQYAKDFVEQKVKAESADVRATMIASKANTPY